MRSRLAPVAIAGFGILCTASTVTAEVRLLSMGQAADVRLTMSEAGPWTPVGPLGTAILNPAGDRDGDGMPSWRRSGDQVLVAWAEGAGERPLRLAVGSRAHGWSGGMALAGSRPVGVPAVAGATPGAWLVAWQECAAEPTTWLALADAESRNTEPSAIDGSAWLVGTVELDASVLVISLDSEARLQLTSVQFILRTPLPNPGPFPDFPTLGDVALVVGPTQAVSFATGSDAAGMAATTAMAESPDSCQAPIDLAALQVAVHEFKGRGLAPERHVLTWWLTPWSLAHVEITRDGPVGPAGTVRSATGAPYSPSLIQRALNQHRH